MDMPVALAISFVDVLKYPLLRHPMTSSNSNLPIVSGAFDITFWWIVAFTCVAAIPALFLSMYKKSN